MIDREQRKPRVLMVTPRYFPYMGGIETHVHEVGCRLCHLGMNVTLLTTIAHHPTLRMPQEDEVEGMRIIRVRAWPRQRDYYIAPEIYSIIKKGNWDLIHCQGCHTFVPLLTMLAAKDAQIPYVLTFHTGGHSSKWRNRIRGVQWHVLRPLLKDAAKLIGVSHSEVNYFRDLLRIPQHQFTVIPNGVTLPNLHTLPLKPTTSPLIISIGRLERYKGHQHIIMALPKIREQRPDIRLLILGVGPYEAELRSTAQRVGVTDYMDIRSVPASNRQEMAEQISQAALVTLFSEYEAHPIAVMEALALQRPVLVANAPGLRELAEQGLVSAIPLHSTPEEIAQAVLQQIEEPLTTPTRLVLPTWEDCAQQLQGLYNATMRRRDVCVS